MVAGKKPARVGPRGSVLLATVSIVALYCAACVLSASSEETQTERTAAPGAPIEARRVMGHRSCVDCHEMEVAAWMKSKHAGPVFDHLLTSSAKEYAEELEIPEPEITRTAICVNCHGTRAVDYLGHAKPIAGVSCEACHRPAGGEDGWLNAHAVYGPPGTPREAESREHYESRLARCRDAGQIRSADLYAMARRCLACHIVGDENLVNNTGHRLSGDRFELLSYMTGEARHNTHLNRRENPAVASLWAGDLRHPGRDAQRRLATVYIVGQLAKGETVLRHWAAAEVKDEEYAEELAVLFEIVLDNLEDTGDDDLVELADSYRDLCDLMLDGDPDLEAREVLDAAGEFARLASSHVADDGDSLVDVEVPEYEPKGTVFQP